MSVLQFIAALANSLAWPLAALIMVIILRRPIAQLLRRGQLKKLKAGPAGLELEYFDEKLQDASDALAEVPTQAASLQISVLPATSNGEVARDDFMADMRQLADVAPSAAILESYARLERVLRDALELTPAAAASRRPISVRSLARRALERGLINQAEHSALEDVTTMRNIVAHEGATL